MPVIAKILHGIPGVENSMYDILIYVPNVLNKYSISPTSTKNAGTKLNKNKCEFEVQKVNYLGRILNSDTIRIDLEKVETIH